MSPKSRSLIIDLPDSHNGGFQNSAFDFQYSISALLGLPEVSRTKLLGLIPHLPRIETIYAVEKIVIPKNTNMFT